MPDNKTWSERFDELYPSDIETQPHDDDGEVVLVGVRIKDVKAFFQSELKKLGRELVGENKPNTGDLFYNNSDSEFYYNEGYNKHRQEIINALAKWGVEIE
jgi:hypothetical protein